MYTNIYNINNSDLSSCRQFLHEVFCNKSDNYYINIWTLPKKQSKFFKNLDKAADYSEKIRNKKVDIYVGCGLLKELPTDGKRGDKSYIKASPAFYMDIDFKGPKKPNCPPDIDSALKLVKGHGWNPTIIVHTGNGIHVWWVFKEIWEFEEGEGDKYDALNRRLQATIKQRAAHHGWELDSTHDRTRVLRIPGTFNWKDKNNPLEVKIYENSGPRYADPLEFEQWFIEKNQSLVTVSVTDEEKAKMAGTLDLNSIIEPPADKLDSQCDIDPKFKASWQRKREDLKDNSPSGYAMSLANLAVNAGWSDQEIAALIISWYRRHSEDMKKAFRKDYIAGTIVKARKALQQRAADEQLEGINLLGGTDYDYSTEAKREKARMILKEKLGLEIIRIVQWDQDEPSFTMLTSKGEVFLPTVDHLIRPSKLQSRVAAGIGKYFTFPKNKWPEIAKLLLILCEKVEVSPDSKLIGKMKSWLNDYLSSKLKLNWDDINESNFYDWNHIEPFIYNGECYIKAEQFNNWAYNYRSWTNGPYQMARDLRRAGCESKKFNISIDGKRTSRRFWRIPPELLEPE
jgi:hypothetical protein